MTVPDDGNENPEEVVNLLSAFCLTEVRWPSKAVEAGIDGLGRPSHEKFTASKGFNNPAAGLSVAISIDPVVNCHDDGHMNELFQL